MKNYFISNSDLHRDSLFIDLGGFTLAASTSKCGNKSVNEDCFLYYFVEPDTIILAVADGVGSTCNAHMASYTALEALLTSLSNTSVDEGSILRGIDAANHAILENVPGSATTLVIAFITADSYRYFSVGDSSSLLMGGFGKIKSKSRGHSAYDFHVESGLELREPSVAENLKTELISYLGSKDYICEVGVKIPMKKRDTVLLGSDGFFENIHDFDPLCFKNRSFMNKDIKQFEYLVEQKMNSTAGHPDDSTFIILRKQGNRNE